jgi:hypothetical protein
MTDQGRLRPPLSLAIGGLLLSILLAPAWAEGDASGVETEAAGIEQALGQCAAKADDRARLACFDVLTAGMRRAGQSEKPSPEARFGSGTLPPQPAQDEEAEVRSVTATLVGLRQRPYGEHVFHLSNGQVWSEIEAGRSRYRTGVEVEIRRTAFGGYMLSTDAGRATRVRRIE